MRIIAFIEQPAVIEKILTRLGMWWASAHSPPLESIAAYSGSIRYDSRAAPKSKFLIIPHTGNTVGSLPFASGTTGRPAWCTAPRAWGQR
jgi:hypothetical protein